MITDEFFESRLGRMDDRLSRSVGELGREILTLKREVQSISSRLDKAGKVVLDLHRRLKRLEGDYDGESNGKEEESGAADLGD